MRRKDGGPELTILTSEHADAKKEPCLGATACPNQKQGPKPQDLPLLALTTQTPGNSPHAGPTVAQGTQSRTLAPRGHKGPFQ